MKYIKIAVSPIHVNYGRIMGLVKEVSDAGVDCTRPDAADTYDPQNMKLMGSHRVIAGTRPGTNKSTECHICTVSMDRMSIGQIDEVGADILIIPAEHFIDAQLVYIVNWYRERHIEVGLTLGCYTPLCFVEESIYDIDRLHIVTHSVDETDGRDNWGWRKSAIDLVQHARKMINEKNPECELAVDGGLRADNMDKLIECNPDIVVLSNAIFKDPDGAAAGVEKYRAAVDTAAEKYGLE